MGRYYKLTESQFEQRANLIARQFAPPIRTCAECGYPYLKGYCCNHCDNTDPSTCFAEQDDREAETDLPIPGDSG
jgi:hypothetical protein